jgi:hypothetical protein
MQQQQQQQQQQFLASQQQTQQQIQLMQQELLESRKQQTEVIKQLGEFHQKQVELQQQDSKQQQLISEKELARTAAGHAPVFRGISNDIEVHRWCIAMERWFETAKIEQDGEKLIIAASVLRDAAQTWWELEKKSNRGVNYTTWKIFNEAIKKQYLPMDVERWARNELEVLIGNGNNNHNVAEYTTRFNELIQLLPGRNELDRIIEYERGLPQSYRMDSVKKRYTSLELAMSGAVAAFNAYRMVNNQGRISGRGSPVINQMEEGERVTISPPISTSSSSSLSSGMPEGFIRQFSPSIIATGPPPQQVSSVQEQLDRLTAIVTQQMNRGGFNNRNNDNSGFRSRSRSRSPNRLEIPKETYEARKKAKQCFRCGQEGHFIKGCRNKANQSN